MIELSSKSHFNRERSLVSLHEKKKKRVFRGFLLGESMGIVGVKLEESVKKHGSDPMRRVFSLHVPS